MSEKKIDKVWVKNIRNKADQALAHVGQSHVWEEWTDSKIDSDNFHMGYDSIKEMQDTLSIAWDHRPSGYGGHYGNCSNCTHARTCSDHASMNSPVKHMYDAVYSYEHRHMTLVRPYKP